MAKYEGTDIERPAVAEVVDTTTGEVIPEGMALALRDQGGALQIDRAPLLVLEEAQKAAKALKDVIDRKPKKVQFQGETYLEFEDWQTLGRFYGVAAKVERTEYVQYGDASGFEATAVAITANGQEISRAEALCLNDEPNWSRKPLYQLKSMAQTRACAKALRNVLSWVAVLAGYKPTPAEEMSGVTGGGDHRSGGQQRSQTSAPAGRPADAERAKLIAEVGQLAQQASELYGCTVDQALDEASGFPDRDDPEKRHAITEASIAKVSDKWLNSTRRRLKEAIEAKDPPDSNPGNGDDDPNGDFLPE